MLILTRKLNGPGLTIGDNIEIRIVRVNGDTVRLGIEAPDSVRVVRNEILYKPFTPASGEDAEAA